MIKTQIKAISFSYRTGYKVKSTPVVLVRTNVTDNKKKSGGPKKWSRRETFVFFKPVLKDRARSPRSELIDHNELKSNWYKEIVSRLPNLKVKIERHVSFEEMCEVKWKLSTGVHFRWYSCCKLKSGDVTQRSLGRVTGARRSSVAWQMLQIKPNLFWCPKVSYSGVQNVQFFIFYVTFWTKTECAPV